MQLSVVRAPGIRMPPRTQPLLVALGRRLAPAHLRVQLVLADDAVLRRLNRKFRGRDRTTDVLSFLYDPPGRRPAADAAVQAELYVSMPRVRAQARERGHAHGCELVLLVLHGMLHLQGHDHEHPAAARRMRAAEAPQLRWLARHAGFPRLQPLVPADGTVGEAS